MRALSTAQTVPTPTAPDADGEPDEVGAPGASRRPGPPAGALSYLVVGVAALAFYAYSWLIQPNRPQLAAVFDEPPALVNVIESGPVATATNRNRIEDQKRRWGWYGEWYDQFHYARMARSLGRFELPGTEWDHVAQTPEPTAVSREPASYSYGLGYPLVGAVFFVLGFKGDPFVVPDGLLMAAAACLTFRLARHLVPGPGALLAPLALVTAAPFTQYFVIPYGNSITAVAVLIVLNVALDRRWTLLRALAVGVTAALCLLGRYVDGLLVLALLAPFVLVQRRRALPFGLAVGACVTLAATVALVTQDRVFGDPFKTPYHYVHNGLDASLDAIVPSQIPNAAVGVFLSGDRSSLFRVQPVLRTAPWLALAPAGLLIALRRREPAAGVLAWGAFVATASSLFYLAWYFGGTDAMPYWVIRFHAPWFPLATVLAVYAGGVVASHLAARVAPAAP